MLAEETDWGRNINVSVPQVIGSSKFWLPIVLAVIEFVAIVYSFNSGFCLRWEN